MRVFAYALMGALTLAAAHTAIADDMSNMKGMAVSGPRAAEHGKGIGVIKAIDTKKGTLTIHHGPIPTVAWPAMTMTFKARPPALLTGLKLGQTIGFDITVRGMSADVTAIRSK